MTATLISRFYRYQRERFPVAALAASLVPALLSSSAVMTGSFSWRFLAYGLVASVSYLFVIRVIDEWRDQAHDDRFHRDRPVQSGLISLPELRALGVAASIVLLLVASTGGLLAIAIALAMLGYSLLAGKEFFLGDALRERFFLYNGANLAQMLLLQALVYALASNAFPDARLVLAHFLFTSAGTIVFELVRKIRLPGNDGTGNDTYTAHLGFAGALAAFAFLAVLDAALFAWLMALSGDADAFWLAVSGVAALIVASFIAANFVKRSRAFDGVMRLSFFVFYAFGNLAAFAVLAL